MDEDDIDALLMEEESIRRELEMAEGEIQEPQTSSRKRYSTEPDVVPSKTRKSVDPAIHVMETQQNFDSIIPDGNSDVNNRYNKPSTTDADLETSTVMTHRPDSSIDYMTIVGVDGVRYYLKVKGDDEISFPLRDVRRQHPQFRGLTDDFDQLFEKATDMLRSKKSVEIPTAEALPSEGQKELWVDKYSPRSYTQLLSKEAINRELLSWLKMWDTVVFGRSSRGRKAAAKAEESAEFDDWKRPIMKLALLCGPPGVGKTTLAHVAARHCGYSVIEMNSSDDRTPDVFRQTLDSGASTKFSVTGDQRPLCLILDEIDGASQPAVDVLIQACKATPGRRNAKKGGQSQTKVHPLMRPVICICNDLYAPSLRELRPFALILRMPEMETVSMGLSLLNVTSAEGMTTNLNDLSALAQRMNYDLRACLNALQFIHRTGHKDVSRMIGAASPKDVQKGLFAAWSGIFALPKPSRTPFAQRHSTTSLLSGRVANILQLTGGSAGNFDRLIDGLFEFFLAMRFKDSGMHKIVGAFEWMRLVDVLQTLGHRAQDYTFMRYQAYLPVYFHLNFATSHAEKLTWPKASAQFRQSVQRSNQILTSFSAGIAAASRPSHRTLILDILPPLVDILQPSIRPVNTQLYSVSERMELKNTVNIMIQFGICLRQDRGVDGQYDFVFDPSLDSLARFSAVRQTKALSYAAKQLISREIALEKMRRSERGGASNEPTEGKDRRMSAWSIQEQAKKVRTGGDAHVHTPQDFFGRSVLKSNQTSQGNVNLEKVKPSPLNNKIWFRFKAGYSNAIRRPVLVRDML